MMKNGVCVRNASEEPAQKRVYVVKGERERVLQYDGDGVITTH